MHPLRISIVTYNIWLTQRWDVRAPALRGFLGAFDPDILCLQELQPELTVKLDKSCHCILLVFLMNECIVMK